MPLFFSSSKLSVPLYCRSVRNKLLLGSSPPESGPQLTQSPFHSLHPAFSALTTPNCILCRIPIRNMPCVSLRAFFHDGPSLAAPSSQRANPTQSHESFLNVISLLTARAQLFIPIFSMHIVYTYKSLSCNSGSRCRLLAKMCQAQLYYPAHIGMREQRLREVLLEVTWMVKSKATDGFPVCLVPKTVLPLCPRAALHCLYLHGDISGDVSSSYHCLLYLIHLLN